jgi:hypothetical protein
MVFSHYYYTKPVLSKAKFKKFRADVQKIYENLPTKSNSAGGYYKDELLLIGDWEGKNQAEITDEVISFNGVGEMAHETFLLTRKKELRPYEKAEKREKVFNCCKTARKPYDLFVCLSLISAKEHFKKDIDISSDGDMKDWEPAFEEYKRITGREVPTEFFRKDN